MAVFYPVNVQWISHTCAFVSEGEAVVPTAVDSAVDTAVETAVEVKEPPPPDITQLCRDTFHKTADYLTGELEGKLLLVLVVYTRALCRINFLPVTQIFIDTWMLTAKTVYKCS